MANLRNQGFQSTVSRTAAHEIDEGLRAYMLSVYNNMAIGLAITGVAAYVTYMMAVTIDPATGGRALTAFGSMLYASPLKWVVMLAPLGLVFFPRCQDFVNECQHGANDFLDFCLFDGAFSVVYLHGVYGQHVATGEWRDYAIDMLQESAVFSIFRRASEMPVYRVEKRPKMARKQGLYWVLNASGMILKRGHDLEQVLKVIKKKPTLSLI